MLKENLPKQILMIKDCTFILPDDFHGSMKDAFGEFLKYRSENLHKGEYFDQFNLFSTFDILLHGNEESRVCGQYALYELVDGKYQIKEGTSPG